MKYIVEVVIMGYPLMIVLILASIYFIVKTKFVQLRFLKFIPKILFEKSNDENKISTFQSFSLIIANHVGTGNIIGVSAAIMYGGPGAIFWMWITALLGSVLSFVENTLGQMYKVEIADEYRGGVAYYILNGIGSKGWGNIIAVVFFICLGLFMPTIQSATISTVVNYTFKIPKALIGLFVSITIGIIIFGKTKRIVEVAEVIVPFMAISYILVALIIIIVNITKLDDVLLLIINNALNKNAIYGCMIGQAISYGVRRGLFSNEAGVGSSPNISSSSDVTHPVKQGILSSFCVFFDTLIICSLTALMILITDCYNIVDEGKILFEGLKGQGYSSFVSEAINTIFINYGQLFITVALFLFAYTSIFSVFFNAQSNLIFLCPIKKRYKIINVIYKILFLIIIFICSIFNIEFAWFMTDIGVAFATFVNIIVIVLLSRQFMEVLNDFEIRYKRNKNIKYYNKNLPCWRKEV